MGDKSGNKSLSRTTPVFTRNYHISSHGRSRRVRRGRAVARGKVAGEANGKHLRDAFGLTAVNVLLATNVFEWHSGEAPSKQTRAVKIIIRFA